MSGLVLTVGHSTRTLEELIEILVAGRVDVLFDVRRYPGSKRYPHFAKDELSRSLPAAGIEYRHEVRMGGRRVAVAGSPNDAWRSSSFRGYADHLSSDQFQAALQGVIDAAGARLPVVMCAEAVPWRCHRQLISDALVARGLRVEHLIGPGSRRVHELNPAAVVDAHGRIRYPSVRQQELF